MKFLGWLVGRGCRRLIIAIVVAVLVVSDLPAPNRSVAKDAVPLARLDAEFKKSIRPLLSRYCLGCHSTKKKTGELDFEQFTTFALVRKGTKSWLKVIEMLDNGEMPPKKSAQPTAAQRKTLRTWVERCTVIKQDRCLRGEHRDQPVPHHPSKRGEIEHPIAWFDISLQALLL